MRSWSIIAQMAEGAKYAKGKLRKLMFDRVSFRQEQRVIFQKS
jgi:hypothetical protein